MHRRGRRLRTGAVNLPVSSFDTGEYCDPRSADVCEQVEAGTSCAYFDGNTNHNVLSFDNFGWSCVVLLQATSS